MKGYADIVEGLGKSCWATRGMLAFSSEREHEVSVYDLAVRPKLEAGMVNMYDSEKDCKKEERGEYRATEVVTWILRQPGLQLSILL